MIALFQRLEEPGNERVVTLIHCGDFGAPIDLLNEVARTIHGPSAKVIAAFPEDGLRDGIEAVELADFCDEADIHLVKMRSFDPVVDRYQVQAQMELDLLRELREAGPAAVRALRLRSPDAAGALEGHLAAWAVAQGKRAAVEYPR